MNTNTKKQANKKITRTADLIHLDTIDAISRLNCQALKKLEIIDLTNTNFTYTEEYIQGQDLRCILKQGKLDEYMLHKVIAGTIMGIKALHNGGIIHRDIKPENIVLAKNGELKVIDYDIARIYKPMQAKEERPKDTTIYGTYGYAPPEQFGFSQTDYSADIYALGKVMLELNENTQNVGIEFIGKKASAFDPNNRYQTIEELEADFLHVKWENKNLQPIANHTRMLGYSVLVIVPYLYIATLSLNLTIISLVVMGMAALAFDMIALNTIKVFGLGKRSLSYNIVLAIIIYCFSLLIMGTYQEIGMSIVA